MEATEQREPGVLTRARPLMLARGFSAGVTALIPIALGRILEQAEYGTFRQFFLVSVTLHFLLLLGIPQSLFFFLPRASPGEQRTYVGQTLLWLLFAGLLAGGFLHGCTPLLTWVGGPQLVSLRLPLAIYCCCYLGSAPLESSLTARGRPGAAAGCYVLSDTARTAAYVLPALLGHGLANVVWGGAIFALLRLCCTWLLLLRDRGAPLFRGDLARAQLAYALPYGAAMLLAIPQQQFHQFAVSSSTDAATFAVFAVGCFNLPVVDLLYTPVSELLMVRLGEIERQRRPLEESAAAFRDAVGKLCYAFLPLAAGLFAIATPFLSLLYGERYAGAAPVFRFAVLSVVLASLPVEGVLRAKGRTRILLVVYGAKLAVTVPLVLGLLFVFGPVGAMAGWVLADVLSKAALLALTARLLAPPAEVQRGLRFAVGALLPRRDLLRAGGAALLAAALALAAHGRLQLSPLGAVLLLGSGFWAAYLATLVAAGVRPRLVLEALRPRRG